ncbi:unnamed protein product [Blepharisma stoltei]|uniref:Alpha-mannosidase n=1 Tax=Blepharisma stoltei TaxID=1481888 RepID=A0AAU9IWD3_9CILI|nr:unnamed protein product [Blepharisma stoltei]
MIPLIVLITVLASVSATIVHLIPHSHLDLGWLRTEDQYFYGCGGDPNNVYLIISEIVSALTVDYERRAVLAEIGFLKKWWDLQTPAMKNQMKILIKTGRLEIVNGGWSMPDEACTNYMDLQENFVIGHEFMREEFGITPKIGYQIDNFGHSATFAEMLIEMGYQGLVLSRIHYHDKKERTANKELEFTWHPSSTEKGIFTHILYNHYSSPKSLHFEGLWIDNSFITDKESSCYTAEIIMKDLQNHVKGMAEAYKSDHIMLFIGDDFTLSSAERTFGSLDLMINYVKIHPEYEMELRYSTISQYFAEIYKTKESWSCYKDDFFPYADYPYSYWTGYYSSRPSLKLQIKKFADYVRATERLVAHSSLNYYQNFTKEITLNRVNKLKPLREYLALLQHHDAITGTARLEVSRNYAKKITKLEDSVIHLYEESLENSVNSLVRCQLNSTICPVLKDLETDKTPVKLIVYNPKYIHTFEILEIPISTPNIQITDEDKNLLDIQILHDPSPFFNTETSIGRYLLLLPISIQALCIRTFTISLSDYSSSVLEYSLMAKSGSISNQEYFIEFSTNNFTIVHDNKEINIMMNYEYYSPNIGDEYDGQSSGIYIFRPGSPHYVSTALCQFKNFKVINTQWVERIYFKCGSEAATKITLWKIGENKLPNIEHYIKPITDFEGKEIIVRYYTNWLHDDTFFIDSNGLKNINKTWNVHGGQKFETLEPIAGNYYAITSHIGFESGNRTFGVIVDRTQGGTATQNFKKSSKHGSDVEIMLLRKCLREDGRGIVFPLIEVAEDGTNLFVLSVHKLFIENSPNKAFELQKQSENPLQLFFGKGEEYSKRYVMVNKENNLLHMRLKDANTVIVRIRCESEDQDFNMAEILKDILPNSETARIGQLDLAENKGYGQAAEMVWGEGGSWPYDYFSKGEKRWQNIEDFKFSCKGFPLKSFEVNF